MKRFLGYLLGVMFSFSLSMFLFFYVTGSTIGSGKAVNSWIKEADTVNLLLENALYFVDDIKLSDELIAKTVKELKKPLGEDLIAPELSGAIDQFYAWLDAKKYKPLKLSFDLTGKTDKVVAVLTNLIKTSYKDLPKCQTGKDAFLCYDPSVSS